MKMDVEIRVKCAEVVKKLWGFITKKEERVSVEMVLKAQHEVKENEKVEIATVLNMNKKDLIDAIASGSKLTKADAGRALDSALEANVKLRTFKATEPEL